MNDSWQITGEVLQRLQKSWQRAWTALGVTPATNLYQRLVTCYCEAHRHYHTLQHLHECIIHLESALTLTEHPGEVEVALWFHDAIYAMQRQDNEQQSALWAKQATLASGATVAVAERIAALILATNHLIAPVSNDACLLVDIDLAILGASPKRFAEYERQVRDEFAWVPLQQFRWQRRSILLTFLDRPAIFNTKPFWYQFEAPARKNLQQSLTCLTD